MNAFIEKVVDIGLKKFKSIRDFDENMETLEEMLSNYQTKCSM